MKPLLFIFLFVSFLGFSQSNRVPTNYNGSVYKSSNKELLLYGLEQKQKLYDRRVIEVISMLNNLSDIYRLKTEKYNGDVPTNLSQYHQQVNNWLVDATKHDLANNYIWIQVQDFYIKHKNVIMSW